MGVTNFQAQGNLKSPTPTECVHIRQFQPDQNPADIFAGMKKYLNSENYPMAAEMYFGAMTYRIYDIKKLAIQPHTKVL